MADDETPEQTEAPAVPPPPSGMHRRQVTPPPSPPPPPAPEPAPAPDVEGARAELEALRLQIEEAKQAAREATEAIAAQQAAARRERRAAWVRSYGGGLAHEDVEALLPDADPATAEGAAALEEWFRPRHSLLRTPPRAPAPEPTDVEKLQRQVWGRPLRTLSTITGGKR